MYVDTGLGGKNISTVDLCPKKKETMLQRAS